MDGFPIKDTESAFLSSFLIKIVASRFWLDFD